MKIALFLIALSFFAANSQSLSGINIALLPAAFNNLKDSYLPYLMCQSTKTALADFTFLGYTFSSGMFKSINLDPAQTTITLMDGFILLESHNMAWSLDAMSTQSAGTEATQAVAQPVTISTDSAHFSFRLIPFNKEGQMLFRIEEVKTDVGNIKVDAKKGFLAKVNDQLTQNPEFKIRINEEFNMFFTQIFLDNVNKFITSYSVIQPLTSYNMISTSIDTQLSIDRSLTQDPVISTMAATSLYNGTIFASANPISVIPYAPVALPLIDQTAQQEFQMFIADYVMNSAYANSWSNGMLAWTLPDDFEKFNLPVQAFVTDDFVTWFPDIVNKYGAGSKVRIMCSDTGMTMPFVKSTADGLEGFEQTKCMMSVFNAESSTYIDFLDFTTDFNWKGFFVLENGNLVKLVAHEGTASNVVINMSTMTDVTADNLALMINKWMITMMPNVMAFRIPIDWFVLENPVISYHMGYVQLVSNAKFQSMTC